MLWFVSAVQHWAAALHASKLPSLRLASCILIAAALVAPSPALAWGDEGHAIIAYIAGSELTPRAAAEVKALLGPNYSAEHNMVHFASWADHIRRQRPETAPWHYVDIELESASYNAERDCPNKDCVVGQIEQEERMLGNKGLPTPERAEALKFLIHFVGDVHQPLHAADHHDRGGNEVQLRLDGKRTNLHRIWDTDEVEQLEPDPVVVAAQLEAKITTTERKAWSTGGADQWANESFKVARDRIYRRPDDFANASESSDWTDADLHSDGPIVERQLEKAGVRLAAVLNRIL